MTAARSLYHIPDSARQDLEQLGQILTQFKQGAIPAARFQAFRVPLGIYEQRESGRFMIRVRLPAGMILPEHMRAVARISRTYGDGLLHLTSRQDIQIHGVSLEGIHAASVELAEAGLSSKGGGGNTVRNIAACPHAGVCSKEQFDVTPHVVTMTEFMLPDPASFQLPRKYKLAFSGCSEDCAAATVSDLGFIAKHRDGVDGFAVYVGGGMGSASRVGLLLEEFIPTSQAPVVAEAIKRLFDKKGNRKNKHRARIRFLVEDLGFDAFRELYRAELAELQSIKVPSASSASAGAGVAGTDAISHQPSSDGFADWRRTHARPQKQSGYYMVEIIPPLGLIEADKLSQLAEVLERHGERMLRATNRQSFVLRWVREDDLPQFHAELSTLGLAAENRTTLRHIVVCAGASTCRLGICLSRGLAKAIVAELSRRGLALSDQARELAVNISGCPNACGRHPLAQIGFVGAARRVRGRLVPYYVPQLGGHVEEGKTVLAEAAPAVPARNVPAFLADLLAAFMESPQHPDFAAFLKAGGLARAGQLAAAYAEVPDFDEDKDFYFDWDAQEVFSLAGRGPGECGAGVFDLIEVDLASAGEALATGRLLSAAALAARALLVTRGEQADTDVQSLTLFRKHFVEPGLVPADLHGLIDQALHAATQTNTALFDASSAQVSNLVAAVRRVYESMGPSLRVATPAPALVPAETPAAPATSADASQDFRGVVCPLNWVKTKMALQKLKSGQTLAVLLDEKGAQNVPASAANEGHEVLSVGREGGHWRVIIRKHG
jgi:sulfite reductase (ferredoxin)